MTTSQTPSQQREHRPAGRARTGRALILALAALAAATAVTIAAVVAVNRRGAGPAALLRPSGIPATVSTGMADLMQLGPLQPGPAPDFTLTDQAGRTMSLASLRGKVVVLEFMDPHCTDICPIVSQEFVDAYRDLGPAAGKVVFAAVNVNQYYHSVANVAAFSAEHQLTSIPDWHFFTGSVPDLQAVWRAYHIDVQAPNPNADIQHTSAVFFIDSRGRQAFLATPIVDHTAKGASFLPLTQVAEWGRGIALVARHLAG